jgi:glycosyltransferase involved in cell wall biosynthesis
MIDRSSFKPLVSLIVPVFNEVSSLHYFFSAVNEELKGLKLELLFIDDGSTDGTIDSLRLAAANDNRIRVIKFSRNFGKEAALTAGIDYCRGDVAIPIDVDLQDPINVIPQFVSKWREGYDVVHGVRSDRQEDGFFKRMSANHYYSLFNIFSDLKMIPHAGDFRLLDRKVVFELRRMPERVRFMKGLFSWVGFHSTEVRYRRKRRTAGASKFNFISLFRFGLEGFINFSSLPMRVWSFVGVLIAIPSLALMLFIVFKTLFLGVDVPGYASLISVVLFLGGTQLISLGIIGEYISQIFTEVKNRPIYIVEEEIDLFDHAQK